MHQPLLVLTGNDCLKFIYSLHQRTPLHMAAEGGHKDTVGYLVDKGAYICIKDGAGVSMGHYTSVSRLVFQVRKGSSVFANIHWLKALLQY